VFFFAKERSTLHEADRESGFCPNAGCAPEASNGDAGPATYFTRPS